MEPRKPAKLKIWSRSYPEMIWIRCHYQSAHLNDAPGITAIHHWIQNATGKMHIELFSHLVTPCNNLQILHFSFPHLLPYLFESGSTWWLALSNIIQFLRKPGSFHKKAPSENTAPMPRGSLRKPMERGPGIPRWPTLSQITPAEATWNRNEPSPPSSVQFEGPWANEW